MDHNWKSFIIIIRILFGCPLFGQVSAGFESEYPTYFERDQKSQGECLVYVDSNLNFVKNSHLASFVHLLKYYGNVQFEFFSFSDPSYGTIREGSNPKKGELVVLDGSYYIRNQNGIITDVRLFKEGREEVRLVYNGLGEKLYGYFYKEHVKNNENSFLYTEYNKNKTEKAGYYLIDDFNNLYFDDFKEEAQSIADILQSNTQRLVNVDSFNLSISLEERPWKFSMDFGSHYLGFVYFESDEISNLHPWILPYYVDLGAAYKRIVFNIKMVGWDGTINIPTTVKEMEEKNNKLTVSTFESSIGLDLMNNNYVSVIPYGGFTFNGLSIYNKEKEQEFLGQYFTPSFGINLDFKWEEYFKTKKDKMKFKPSGSFFYTRLNAGVYPEFFKEKLKTSGNVYFVSVAFGWYSKSYRVKK